jgi:sugar lactone lactonase YvrE
MTVLTVLIVALIAVFGYLLAWPVPIAPRRWASRPDKGFTGPFALNRGLSGLNRLDLGGGVGPEHIACGPDGKLYTGMLNGDILRMNPEGGEREIVANTGGRVLGLTFDARGRIIAADALRGLLAVERDGTVHELATHCAGEPILFANSAVVAANGFIYLSDSSRRFAPKRWGGTFEAYKRDCLEQSATGRVLMHDPATGETRCVAHGLSFANGVALSSDEGALFVAETSRYRIWRLPIEARDLDLSAGPKGGATVLFENLPGFPDNLMRGEAGRIWVGCTKPRNPMIDRMADKLWLRKVALRLPKALQPIPKDHAHVFAFNEAGVIVADLQDPDGIFPDSTAACEFGGRVYLGSLTAGWIGWVKWGEQSGD